MSTPLSRSRTRCGELALLQYASYGPRRAIARSRCDGPFQAFLALNLRVQAAQMFYKWSQHPSNARQLLAGPLLPCVPLVVAPGFSSPILVWLFEDARVAGPLYTTRSRLAASPGVQRNPPPEAPLAHRDWLSWRSLEWMCPPTPRWPLLSELATSHHWEFQYLSLTRGVEASRESGVLPRWTRRSSQALRSTQEAYAAPHESRRSLQRPEHERHGDPLATGHLDGADGN